jgi:hypothetical protein
MFRLHLFGFLIEVEAVAEGDNAQRALEVARENPALRRAHGCAGMRMVTVDPAVTLKVGRKEGYNVGRIFCTLRGAV